jgi:glycosyltransferase involved in cell wall biosynthesis
VRKPLVSVVTPVYNGEAFLREALDSVFAQNYEPFVAIVVDDGSTDGSGAIARSYAGARYIYQENRGQSAAYNAGIEAARGEFIALADQDDVQLRHRLSVQVGHLIDHPEVTLTLGRQVWITPPPSAVPDRVWGDLDGIPLASMVFRKQAVVEIGGFDTALRTAEDTDLLVRLRERGHSFVVLPEVVVHRRYHGQNIDAGRRVTPMPASVIKAKLDRARRDAEGKDLSRRS